MFDAQQHLRKRCGRFGETNPNSIPCTSWSDKRPHRFEATHAWCCCCKFILQTRYFQQMVQLRGRWGYVQSCSNATWVVPIILKRRFSARRCRNRVHIVSWINNKFEGWNDISTRMAAMLSLMAATRGCPNAWRLKPCSMSYISPNSKFVTPFSFWDECVEKQVRWLRNTFNIKCVAGWHLGNSFV